MKKNLRKLLALGIAAGLSLSALMGCAGNESTPEPAAETATTEATVSEEPATEPAAEAATTEATAEDSAAEATTEEEVVDLPIEELEMKDITPAKLVSEIKAGWNLGNSLDCFGQSGLAAETHWGNPATTKEMIDAVVAKGFNSIRVPITWGDHMSAAPDYAIDPEWMARVKEVVDYCIDDGLYVIIDAHHEEAWRIPDDAHIDATADQMAALWEQVATEFKDYDYHLMFEGNNEPRVKGGDNEWNGGTSEVRKNLDTLNQLFVDTVRATGGNNEYRLLLIASVANSPVIQTIAPLKIPEDDHLAVSIHAYTPYAFTYEDPAAGPYDNWDGSHKSDIATMFQDVDRILLSKGIPVLLTEYGAVDKHNEDEVVAWVTEYLTRANKYGIPCYWWDNGNFDQEGEKFAIFNRKDCTWYREKVADALIEKGNER